MIEPHRRERLRPLELVTIAALIAVAVGAITLMVTRDPILALIFFGATFVIDLVVIAMLMLVVTPNKPMDGEVQRDAENRPHE